MGVNTLKGGRIQRVEKYIAGDTFMLTYGGGVADVNLHKLLAFHKVHGMVSTVTAVRPPLRFGELLVEKGSIWLFIGKQTR